MSEDPQCPNCGQPVANDGVSCGACGYRLEQPEPGAPDAEDLQALAATEGRRLHPLSPVVFAVSGVAVGLLAAFVAGPELGVALGLLGGGLGVWALLRSGLLR